MDKVFIQREPLLQAMRDAGEIGVKSIGLIGDGEPTVNPNVWDALYEGRNAGVDMSISTSGVIVNNDERRAAILENCTWMRFCISAGTREGYQQIHGKDYFELMKRNIADIVEYRDKHNLDCEIGMQAVFVPTLMAEEMIEESKLAIQLGVDYLVIKQCSLPDEGESGMAQFDVNLYDDKHILDVLQQCEDMSTDLTDIIPKWNVMQLKGQKPYDNCPSIPLISEISGNGNWATCGYFFDGKPESQKFVFGNLHDKSLKEIWESDRYWDIIEYMVEHFDNKKECRGCCRQDQCNIFCDTYRNPPRGINFI